MPYVLVDDVRNFVEKSIRGETGHNSNTATSWRTILAKWVAFARKVGLSETEISEEVVDEYKTSFSAFVTLLGSTDKTAAQYHKGLLRMLEFYRQDKKSANSKRGKTVVAAPNKSASLETFDYPIPLTSNGSARLTVPRTLSEQDRSDLSGWLRRYAEFFASES